MASAADRGFVVWSRGASSCSNDCVIFHLCEVSLPADPELHGFPRPTEGEPYLS